MFKILFEKLKEAFASVLPVTLIVLAERADDDAKARVKTCRHGKTYRLGLHGFSHYRLVVVERATGDFFFNRQGGHLKPLVQDIWNAASNIQKES